MDSTIAVGVMKRKGRTEIGGERTAVTGPEDGKVRALLPVFRLGSRFLGTESRDEIFQLLIEVVQDQLKVNTISIMEFDKDCGYLKIVAATGLPEKVVHHAKLRPGEQIGGRVFENRTPMIVNGLDPALPGFERSDQLHHPLLSAAVCVPLMRREKAIGVINIGQAGEGRTYRGSEVELVSILAQLTGAALEHLSLVSRNEEAARLRTLFEQYVSPDAAPLLIDQGHQLKEIGTIQDLTVLFADIRNFTRLAQRLDLPTLRDFLNDFFNLLTMAVDQHQGTLDKFVGDGALVIFGAHLAQDSPADRAITTGRKILKRFTALRKQYQKHNDVFGDIGLGIGISCGEMFLGNLGSEKRFDYTVIGAGVNIAQRLASQAEGDTVQFTSEIGARLSIEVPVIRTENVRLRGFDELIIVHQIC
jgi:adenylate cyclase